MWLYNLDSSASYGQLDANMHSTQRHLPELTFDGQQYDTHFECRGESGHMSRVVSTTAGAGVDFGLGVLLGDVVVGRVSGQPSRVDTTDVALPHLLFRSRSIPPYATLLVRSNAGRYPR